MTKNKLPCIFVDTNRFLSEDVEGEAWKELLRLHKEKKIIICLSQIVRDEWVSNIRDNFISCSIKAKGQIEKQQGALKNNPLYKNAGENHFSHNIPDNDGLMIATKNEAERYVTDFIDKNGIFVVKITDTHTQEVFRKFFSWDAPFNTAKTPEEFHNDNIRDARKKHIPDAFIIEAISSFLNQDNDVHVICNDGHFKNSLPAIMKGKIYGTVGDIIKSFEMPEVPSPHVPLQLPATSSKDEATTIEKTEAVDDKTESSRDFLSSFIEEDRHLMLRILGYTYWFSKPNPLSKEELYQRLLGQGHTLNAAENVAQRLVLRKALKDIGNHYLPFDMALCKQAASEIMPEIIALLDQG